MSRPVAHLTQAGGFCARATLITVTSRREVERALRSGEIVRVGHGRYGLRGLDSAVTEAVRVGGVLSHLSAALWHGWEVKTVPDRPHVLVPRHRRVSPVLAAGVELHRADLLVDDVVEGICTTAEQTLLHCLRTCPEDEGLAVVDSALRHGLDPAVLRRIRITVRGAGRSRVLRVLDLADGRAANPFESVLRHICSTVPGIRVEPQRVVVGTRQTVRPDLVDVDRRIVVEADSFEWHGGRGDLARDARRYNHLVADGWLVLRFSWEDVMIDPDYVREVLVTAVALVDARTQLASIPPANACPGSRRGRGAAAG